MDARVGVRAGHAPRRRPGLAPKPYSAVGSWTGPALTGPQGAWAYPHGRCWRAGVVGLDRRRALSGPKACGRTAWAPCSPRRGPGQWAGVGAQAFHGPNPHADWAPISAGGAEEDGQDCPVKMTGGAAAAYRIGGAVPDRPVGGGVEDGQGGDGGWGGTGGVREGRRQGPQSWSAAPYKTDRPKAWALASVRRLVHSWPVARMHTCGGGQPTSVSRRATSPGSDRATLSDRAPGVAARAHLGRTRAAWPQRTLNPKP